MTYQCKFLSYNECISLVGFLITEEAVFGIYIYFLFLMVPCGSDGKESACNVGDLGSISVLGRSPGEGKGYPLQYSCLENFMNRGAWQATVPGISKSWT